jgi:hypothetical protein
VKRVLPAAVIFAALFALSYYHASAMVEYCPAHLSIERVQDRTALARTQSARDDTGTAAVVKSSTFGFTLSALGPRTFTSATLAFDTSAGWYTVALPEVTLIEKDRHYRDTGVGYIRHDWVTRVMYVAFPSAITIAHAWVYEATVHGDPLFGWDEKGTVLCPPPPGPSSEQQKKNTREVWAFNAMDPQDADRLSDPPTERSLVLHASPSRPLESADCADPFREAEVASQARPEFPSILAAEGWGGVASSNVSVALQPDGSLRDEWIWGPSGMEQFDKSALTAAKRSTYRGARAYCQPVPSIYIFRVTFST